MTTPPLKATMGQLSEAKRWEILVEKCREAVLASHWEDGFHLGFNQCIEVLNDFPEPVRVCVISALARTALESIERDANALYEFKNLEVKNARPQ